MKAPKSILSSAAVALWLLAIGITPTATAVPPSIPSCDGLAKAVESIEKQCVAECDLKQKIILMDTMISLEKRMHVIGCEDVSTWNSLCGGLMDEETTSISVYPSAAELSLEEGENTVQLYAEFEGAVCKDGVPTLATLFGFLQCQIRPR
jgi:hypothetical protein